MRHEQQEHRKRMLSNLRSPLSLVGTLEPKRLQHSHQLGHDAEHEVPTTAFMIFPGSSDHALGQQHVNHKIPLDETPKFAALQTVCDPP